ncbi:hypothetical protein SNK03_007473 [Fusarium graminearum]
MERPDLHADLHLIAWLNRWRSKSGSRPIQYTSISEKYFAFWSEIDVDDAREHRLHQQRKVKASRIPIQVDREVAEDKEKVNDTIVIIKGDSGVYKLIMRRWLC